MPKQFFKFSISFILFIYKGGHFFYFFNLYLIVHIPLGFTQYQDMFFSEVPEKQHLIWHIPPLSNEPFPPPSSAVHVRLSTSWNGNHLFLIQNECQKHLHWCNSMNPRYFLHCTALQKIFLQIPCLRQRTVCHKWHIMFF